MKSTTIANTRLLPAVITLGLFSMGNVLGNATVTDNSTSKAAIRVLTAKPQAATDQIVSVEQPAEVSAYYQVGLLAKVAGTVKSVEKALGDKVTAGEVLVQLDTGDASGILATINAPFDGVVSARAVDPGLFVPSAAIVPEVDSLLTVDRTDIVTISMAVPETYVTYLSKDTIAEVSMDALPGKIFRTRLTRIAPSLKSGDRTLSVELDLFNGTADEFAKFQALAESNGRSDLKSRTLPYFPEGLPSGQAAGLLPGMYGKMKLTMRQPQSALLVPSSAIVRDGGMPFLFKNENGVVRRKSIVIQIDNGTTASVRWSVNGTTQDLSPDEEIVTSNQGELQDGTVIQATLSK
jgi:multidrug efflux pump subunit AcrA (membrane-fusion protein)